MRPLSFVRSDERAIYCTDAPSNDLSSTANNLSPRWDRSRASWWLVGCGIVLAVGVSIGVIAIISKQHSRALAETEREIANIALVVSEQSDRAFQALELVQKSLIERMQTLHIDSAEDYVERNSGVDVHLMLKDKISGLPHVDAVTMISSEGKLINFSRYWPIPQVNVADRDYFQALKSDPSLLTFISQPVRNRGNGTWTIYIARKFTGSNGEFLGLVLGAMELRYFEKFFGTVSLGEGSSIALFRTDGMLLARHPNIQSAIGRSYPGVIKALGDKTHGKIRLIGQMDNKDRLFAVHRLAHFPIAVSVGMNVDAALADWRREAELLGVGAALFIIVVTGIVFLGVRQIRSHELLVQARTDQAEAEKARAVAEAELLKKERLSALGQLTATVAHELRNPLSAIRNTLPVLKQMAGAAGGPIDRPVSRIERSIVRCDQLISSLLEYTKVRELVRRPVALDQWLGELLDEQALPGDITLDRRLGSGDATVELDADRFRRVVINLIDNAAQAIGAAQGKEADRTITVATKVTDQLEMTISDNGPGIAPEVLPRIFEPLFSTKSFGTGLGLPTVKQIVEQHGGRISIDSPVGCGAVVRIVLPRYLEQRQAA